MSSLSGSITSSVATGKHGATRVFSVTEMKKVGDSLQPTGEDFRFSTDNFAAPRGPWQFGVKLRTVRHDLPGSEEPSEQVLGWNYTPFQVAGVWDDRYGGQGYAADTRARFEAMVKRGRVVRVSFEEITIFGLIVDFSITRFRKDRQGYSFTLSPHNRYEGETSRVDASPGQKVTSDPRTSVKKARRALEALQAAQARARASNASRVQQALATDLFRELDSDIANVAESITFAESTVNNEILKAQDATNALNRGAQTMASVKTGCFAILTRTRGVASTTALALDTAVEVLQYEAWKRGVCDAASRLALTADLGHRDFELRAQPKPTRLHRVRPGETLYTISNLYFGTPHHWREILRHNHLSSIILEGGELLSIPEPR